jgi:hypothetical protein
MTAALAPDYPEARRRFLAAARSAGASVDHTPQPHVRGPDGGELAIDVARLGPLDAPAVLVVVSGTHGVEGYAGSALQAGLLAGPARNLPAGLGLVLIHALNPYGFAWIKRTNEDNVDLNRNFIDWDGPVPTNPGYDELAEVLVPEEWDEATRASSTAALLGEVERRGLPEMQQVISGGQYRHERGVFYGGVGPAWSNRWLRDRAATLSGPASRIGVVDLHTGLGPWGEGELIVCEPRDHPRYRRAEGWWGEVRSMEDGESVSAALTGDWLGAIDQLWPGREVTGAALEFGTVDQVQVLQALRGEAWLHGATRGSGGGSGRSPATGRPGVEAAGPAIRRAVRAAFADDDPAWLAALTARFDRVVAAAIDGLTG